MSGVVDQQFGGDWTEKKLAALRKYLNAYLIALKKQPFNLMYVDAFAGTGYRKDKTTSDVGDFLQGFRRCYRCN